MQVHYRQTNAFKSWCDLPKEIDPPIRLDKIHIALFTTNQQKWFSAILLL